MSVKKHEIDHMLALPTVLRLMFQGECPNPFMSDILINLVMRNAPNPFMSDILINLVVRNAPNPFMSDILINLVVMLQIPLCLIS